MKQLLLQFTECIISMQSWSWFKCSMHVLLDFWQHGPSNCFSPGKNGWRYCSWVCMHNDNISQYDDHNPARRHTMLANSIHLKYIGHPFYGQFTTVK